jgi:succinate dehydrogenase/fumarate reductase cytochrome b subunit
MQDRYARYGSATGVLFVIFVIVGFLVQPKPPAADATAQEILNYVVDKQNTLHVVQLLFGAAGLFFIWFIGTLRHLLSRAEGDDGRLANTAFGGGLIAVATLMVGGGLAAVAALHPVENGANVTHALIDASLLVPAVGAPAAFVFFAANGLSILRSGYLPAWMGWFAIVSAVLNILGIGAVFTDHGVFAGDGVLGFFLGFLCFLLWTLLASILLYRKLGEAPAPGPA